MTENSDRKNPTSIQRELFRALELGQAALARSALCAGADPNAFGASNPTRAALRSPLEIAAGTDRDDLIEMLVESGARVGLARPDDGASALATASRLGKLKAIAKLAELGAGISTPDFKGFGALHHACSKGQSKAAKLLLELGADANAADHQGATPLMLSAERGTIGLAKTLLSFGANPLAADLLGHDALMLACFGAHAEMARLLLPRSDPQRAAICGSASGSTALMAAAETFECPELLAEILDAGADLGAQDHEQQFCALAWAARQGHLQNATFLADRWLEDASPYEPNEARKRIDLALALSMRNEQLREASCEAMARMLLARGANPDQTIDNMALLSWGIYKRSFGASRALFDGGANLEALDGYGRRPLHFAASLSESRNVEFVLGLGADPASLDAQGRTALELCLIPNKFGQPSHNACHAGMLRSAMELCVLEKSTPRIRNAETRQRL